MILDVVYSYTYIHADLRIIHIDAMNNGQVKTSLKKYTSHFIVRVCVWEGVGDWTKTATYWPPLLWPSALCLSCSPVLLNRRPGGSAFCWLSLPHLVSNLSGPQLTDFLSSPSYIIVQSPTQSLEWHVWSSSSGNNCHAGHSLPVHQSMSVPWDFYLVPYFSQPARLCDFFS